MIAVFLLFALFVLLGSAALIAGIVWLGVTVHRKQKSAGLWGPTTDPWRPR